MNKFKEIFRKNRNTLLAITSFSLVFVILLTRVFEENIALYISHDLISIVDHLALILVGAIIIHLIDLLVTKREIVAEFEEMLEVKSKVHNDKLTKIISDSNKQIVSLELAKSNALVNGFYECGFQKFYV